MVVIVISGQPGAGSTTTARLLAERKNLRYFSPGRVFKDIGRGTLKEQFYYREFKQRCDQLSLEIPNFSATNDTKSTLDLWNTSFGKDSRLHKVLDDLQKLVALQGDAVLDGKLSLHMIPNATLKVWLKASRAKRAERTNRRDGSFEDAEKKLHERESIERNEWHAMYGIDYWAQEALAHLVIDTTDKSPSQAALEIEQRITGV